jgi:tetratricopeptide (TPR) repeat protein
MTWHETFKYKDKETLWLDSVNKNPKSYIAQNNVGTIYFSKNKFEAAYFHFMKAMEIDPNQGTTHNNIGLVLERMGNIENAQSYYKSAINLDPMLIDAYIDLGLSLSKQGKSAEANRAFETAINLPDTKLIFKKKHKAYFHLANAHYFDNNFGDAIKNYRNSVAYRPGFEQAHYNLAIALLNTGEKEESILHLKKILKINPNHQTAMSLFNSLVNEN